MFAEICREINGFTYLHSDMIFPCFSLSLDTYFM